ncbi:MAG: beta-galactosidase, partial [Microbacterium aurantiacum]
THPDAAGIDAIVAAVVAGAGIRPVVADLPAGVEAARRGDLVTIINHTDAAVSVTLEGTDAETGAAVDHLELDPQQVAFIRVAITRPEAEQAIAPAEGLAVPVA